MGTLDELSLHDAAVVLTLLAHLQAHKLVSEGRTEMEPGTDVV